MKIPVTVIVPVKNEEKNLPGCLERLGDFSEIYVVDSQSTDRTPEIARKFGAKYIEFEWSGKFPKKRNWCLRNLSIKNQWVLFLDADEYLDEKINEEISIAVQSDRFVGYYIYYSNFFMGRHLKYGDRMKKLPLFKTGSGGYEKIEEDYWSELDMEVHEHPILDGAVGRLNNTIEHRDYKGLESYIHKHNSYSTWEANRYLFLKLSNINYSALTFRQQLKYRLINSWVFGPLYFISSFIFKRGFLDGREGFLFAVFKMIYFFQIKCKINEMKSLKF